MPRQTKHDKAADKIAGQLEREFGSKARRDCHIGLANKNRPDVAIRVTLNNRHGWIVAEVGHTEAEKIYTYLNYPFIIEVRWYDREGHLVVTLPGTFRSQLAEELRQLKTMANIFEMERTLGHASVPNDKML